MYTTGLYHNGVKYEWGKESGWKPGANTLLYFPLTNNSTDTQHNISLTATGTVSYTKPSGASINCATFNGSSYLYNSSVSTSYLPQGINARTMSVWIMFTGTVAATSHLAICGYGNASNNNMFNIFKTLSTETLNNSFSVSQYGAAPSGTSVVPQRNVWYNLITTYGNGVWKLYVNNSLTITWNYTIATSGTPLFIWNRHGGTEICPSGYASNFIIENKARTAQEVSDYYNGTKKNYGL